MRPEVASQSTGVVPSPTDTADVSPELTLAPRPTPRPEVEAQKTSAPKQKSEPGPPANLGIPFDPSDLVIPRGFLSPYGVVRKPNDRPELGHSGIDVPLVEGASILAVADGTVISIYPAQPKFPGQIILLLIQDGEREGEGWVFLVEHVVIDSTTRVGDSVKQGDILGTSAIPTARGNSHMQLSYYFNSFEFSREHTCWIDSMEDSTRSILLESVEPLLTSIDLIESWKTATDDGQLPLKGLLESPDYPPTPQLCYPQGTDVRISAESATESDGYTSQSQAN